MTFLEAKSADLASGEALDVVTERPQLASRVRDACSFELWTSLFADDCVLLFQSRDDLIRGPVTSLLIFGNSGFACTLVVVMQRPRLRQCTSHRLEWRTRLRTHPASTLMALVSLTFVRQANNISDGCFWRPKKYSC